MRPAKLKPAKVLSGLLLGVLFLTGCSGAHESDKDGPPKEVSPYILSLVEHYSGRLTADSLQGKILADNYVSDREMRDAYDELVSCLSQYDITPGWDLSFASDANYGPDLASQDRARGTVTDPDEQSRILEELQEKYDSCSRDTVDVILEIYSEQIHSADGRSRHTRLRDALVDCGFDEFSGMSEDQVEKATKTDEFIQSEKYLACMAQFLASEN